MFKGDGAITYDCSSMNSIVIVIVVFMLGLFINMNTYFNQFYKISQLPEDRDEKYSAYDIKIDNDINKVNVSFKYRNIFSITKEIFIQSLKVVLKAGNITIKFHGHEFGDYSFDETYASFNILSPLHGNVSASLMNFQSMSYSKKFKIDYIAWLYPGFSLAAELKDGIYQFSNIGLDKSNLLTFFSFNNARLEQNKFFFRNGFYFNHIQNSTNINDNLKKNPKCTLHENKVDIFAAPPPGSNPYDVFISVYNPISQYIETNPDAQILLAYDEFGYYQYLQYIPNIKFHKVESECNYFREARIHLNQSNNFTSFKKRIDKFEKKANHVVILHNFKKKPNITNLKPKLESMCPTCDVEMIKADSDDFIEFPLQITRTQGIISLSEYDIGHMVFLKPKSFVIFAQKKNNMKSNSWMKKMAKDLDLYYSEIIYEYTNDEIIVEKE